MKKVPVILALVLIAILGPGCSSEDLTFERLSKVEYFAFGGTGFAGSISQGEKDYQEILARPSAKKYFLRLLQKGNPQAQCYALVGLRKLDPAVFESASASCSNSTVKVQMMSGCIGSSEPLSQILKDIVAGFPDQRAESGEPYPPVFAKAENLIFPEFLVENMPAKEVLAMAERLSKDVDPDGVGISFVLDPSVDESKLETITIHLRGVPVLSLCDFIKSLSSLNYSAKDDAIFFTRQTPTTP